MGIHSVGTSDAALVRRVQTGDTGAYADLVARYRDRLGRYALHMLGNREDAEEVLQDSFVRAYRSLARCDDPERFGAWLYGILVNRCRTAGARAARRARRFVHDPVALETAPLAGPDGRTAWDDMVRWALARLPSASRGIFGEPCGSTRRSTRESCGRSPRSPGPAARLGWGRCGVGSSAPISSRSHHSAGSRRPPLTQSWSSSPGWTPDRLLPLRKI